MSLALKKFLDVHFYLENCIETTYNTYTFLLGALLRLLLLLWGVLIVVYQ